MEEAIYPPTIRVKCWELVRLEKSMSLRFTGLPRANRSTSSLSCPSIVIYVLRKPAVFASEASECGKLSWHATRVRKGLGFSLQTRQVRSSNHRQQAI